MVLRLKYGVPSLMEGLAALVMLPKVMFGIRLSGLRPAFRCGISMPSLVRSTLDGSSGK